MDSVPASTSLVWAEVARPRVPLVYLDLNHFILMARARKGTAPPGYTELLDAAVAAVREARVTIPLSAEHVAEMATLITDPRHRKDVADVMEMVTGFQYLLGRTDIAQLEVEAGFRALFDEQHELLPLPLVGFGFGRAFGMVGGLRLEDEHGNSVAGAARRKMGEERFARMLQMANHHFERAMLDGPADSDIPDLRAAGYEPEASKASLQSRLDYELALSDRLIAAPALRRGRLRDLVSAREASHEWLVTINRVRDTRMERGLPIPELSDLESTRRLLDSMPHNQVAVSMKTRYHRNPTHTWTTNDIADIDALSVAFAYCDVVFTDKAARAALHDAPELRAIPTFLPRRPIELSEWLVRQPKLNGAGLLLTATRGRKHGS